MHSIPVPTQFRPRFALVTAGLACLLAVFPPTVQAAEGGLKVIRTFTGWRDAASFKRISEYFGGNENPSHQTVLRTHSDQRAGYYFLVRAANEGTPAAVQIKLQLVAPTEPKLRTFSFSTKLKSGDTVLNLGLTGKDWPDAKANPVAWKLDFVAADGRIMASDKSYLWEKPAAK